MTRPVEGESLRFQESTQVPCRGSLLGERLGEEADGLFVILTAGAVSEFGSANSIGEYSR